MILFVFPSDVRVHFHFGILSACPDTDAENLLFHIQCVDETGWVVPEVETGLPATIIKADWLAV